MRLAPHLTLTEIEIDSELARQLPRKLAYYHLALPLSSDGSDLSVALADPDNQVVLDMLATLFNARVSPVHSDAEDIRTALDRVWASVKRPPPHILTWGSTSDYAASAYGIGEELGALYDARVTDIQHDDLVTAARFTQQDTYSLSIVHAAPDQSLGAFIQAAATPVLLLRGDPPIDRPFRRVLLALRGHAPDLSAVSWLIPIVQTYRSELTILAVSDAHTNRRGVRVGHSLAALLDPDQEQAQHLTDCTNYLSEAGINGYIKLCQGDPLAQILTEYRSGPYSLLVIVSEAQGRFVAETWERLTKQEARCAVLVIKPALIG